VDPCDILMSSRFSRANHVMRLKWNEKYHPRIIETTKYMLPNPYENCNWKMYGGNGYNKGSKSYG